VTSGPFQARLGARAQQAGISLDPSLAERLEAYFQLLATWNRKINLSGMDLTDAPASALDRLLIEPVVAAQYAIRNARVVDIGSGGGSPAIPFALAMDAAHLLMVESRNRKAVFLREASRAVGLASVDVAAARFEDVVIRADLREAHDLLTVRAVRIETATLAQVRTLVRPAGQLFLFQSADAAQRVVPGLRHAGTHSLVSSLASQLTILERVDPPR
jgi:16S rRNA (guanine527-N7)-methyltransferase